MSTSRTSTPISRRAALAGFAASSAALGGNRLASATSQETADLTNHPIVGTWLGGRTPADLAPVRWSADGNMTYFGEPVSTGPDGAVVFSSDAVGTWEPISERGIHFTFTGTNYDATGAVTGYYTVDGHPVVSEDGMSYWDDAKEATVTIRDATGAIVQEIGKGDVPPIGGVRMAPGRPGFDEILAMLEDQQGGTPVS